MAINISPILREWMRKRKGTKGFRLWLQEREVPAAGFR